MQTPPDQPYYDWLCSQIEIPKLPKKTYDGLLELLHNVEFFWVVVGDDNRIADAREMRQEFLRRMSERNPEKISGYEFKSFVSVLEIIIVVSRMLEWNASGEAPEWAWRLIENLHLIDCNDPFTPRKRAVAEDILERFIWRTYERNGQGGFFPLVFAKKDQTKVEIWYQLNDYVMEIVQE